MLNTALKAGIPWMLVNAREQVLFLQRGDELGKVEEAGYKFAGDRKWVIK